VVAIILAFGGMGVFSLIWGQLAGALLRVLFLCYWGMGHWKPCWHFYSQDLKRYISFGLYQMGERTVNYFNSNLDYILIGSLLGAKSLGYYTLAYNLVLKPSSIINPILTRVAFPIFAKVQKDAGRLKRGYLKVLQLLSLINFPIMAGLAVVAPVAVPLIFGKQWLPSIILIQILTIVGLLCSTGNPIGALLLAKGRADLGFKWNIALTITQIPGLYLGARLGGMVGVAIAYAILMSIYSVFEYLILIRTLLGPCLREYIRNIWPSLWMSVLMAVIVLCIQLFSRGLLPYYSLIIQVLCGVAIYVGLITYRQKILVFEIKELALGKKIA
jgi:lipopolysaccharide exporter